MPIGVDPGPFIANLSLWFFENSARCLNKTFRLIDDISSINSDGVFQEHVANIYHDSLTLNKDNSVDTAAHVLDNDFKVDNDFEVKLFDKRQYFLLKYFNLGK